MEKNSFGNSAISAGYIHMQNIWLIWRAEKLRAQLRWELRVSFWKYRERKQEENGSEEDNGIGTMRFDRFLFVFLSPVTIQKAGLFFKSPTIHKISHL